MIRCGKTERGKPHPTISGFEKINVSSQGPAEWKGLSPMIIGNFNVVEPKNFTDYFPDGIFPGSISHGENDQITHVQRFENYWQGGKIYMIDLLDSNDQEVTWNINTATFQTYTVKKSFFDRRAQIFSETKGKRRALPKAKFGVPVYSYYGGYFMDYITSRKKIYCPYYESLVINSPEFIKLKQKYLAGQKLLIVGPDGRDIPITQESLHRAINDPTHIFGHELVICCLLIDYRPWNE